MYHDWRAFGAKAYRTMGTIRELDPVTIGQIAAGEIIERPVSVVKELVENAVDAGATRIAVAIERGGIDLIEVADDGTGISPDDLALAFRRHATSKLSAAADLECIATLGFRGEGLASIAAVSELEVVSRQSPAPVGTRVSGHAETIGLAEPAAAPCGTRVRARALFETIPVRREYLRAADAEFNRISSWLSSFALGYPRIAFTLRHDGKDVWAMPAAGDDRERLAMVFGPRAARALIALDCAAASTLGGTLRGYISAPGNDRSDRKMQLLFVNGRLLRSAVLGAAWTSGYSTFTMLGRHPFGVLFLDLPAAHVDSNVHPTKSDVRLRYAQQTFDAVRRSIAATLSAHARARFDEQTRGMQPADHAGVADDRAISFFAPPAPTPDGSADGSLRVLAQLHRTYILAADGDGLLLVDQHAAHERIAYEAIAAAARERATSQPLLVPQILELDAAQSAALDHALAILRDGGLEIETFGERTYRVVATPSGYGARTFDFAGLLDDLTQEPKARDVRERVWAMLACRSVTIAGEALETAEMATLVERLQTCSNPMHCPHGRPTIVRLDRDDLARMFKRV